MRNVIGLGILASFVLVSPAASAALITFDFSGTIEIVGTDINDGTFSIGQNVSGQFSFESTTPDSDAASDVGRYDNAISNVDFTFDAYSGTAGPGGITTRDDAVLGFGTFDVYAARGISAVGADVNGRALQTFNLQLLDDTLTMLASDALPLTPPSPFRNDNANTTFLILQFDPVNPLNIVAAQVRATVDSIGLVTSVPEPSTLFLLAASLMLGLARAFGGTFSHVRPRA